MKSTRKGSNEKQALKHIRGLEKHERSERPVDKKIMKTLKGLEKHERSELKGRK